MKGRLREPISRQLPIIGAVALKFTGAALSFLITFSIARAYGAEISGQYALFSMTVVTFGVIAVFGNDHLLVRRMAGFSAVGRLDLARLSFDQALGWSWKIGLLFAAILLALALPFSNMLGVPWAFAVAAATGMVLQPLFMIANSAVRSTHRLVQSQALQVIQPAVIILVVAGSVWLLKGSPATVLIAGFTAGLAIGTGASLLYVRRLIGQWPTASEPHPDEGRSHSVKLGLTIALDMATVWAALTLTGGLMSVADAGVFRVCLQFINAVAILGTTLDGLMGPRLASQFARGDIAASRRTLNRSAILLAFAGGIPLALIAIFSESLLGLMGDEFRGGATALRILALGQFAVLLAGAAGTALNMHSREDISLWLAVSSCLLVVPLMALLTPWLGLEGAALGLVAMWLIRYQGSNLFARIMLGKSAPSAPPDHSGL